MYRWQSKDKVMYYEEDTFTLMSKSRCQELGGPITHHLWNADIQHKHLQIQEQWETQDIGYTSGYQTLT